MQNNITISEVGEIGTLFISEETQKTIDYLHNNIRGREWAGILIYDIKSGKLADLKDIILETIDIYPTVIGSHSYFEVNTGEANLDLYRDIPESLEALTGIVHTHHEMGAFFSQEDYKEYTGNAAGFYLSLVVDCKDTYKARIVIPLKATGKMQAEIREPDGKLNALNIDLQVKQYLVGDLKVITKRSQKEWLVKRLAYIRNETNKPIFTEYKEYYWSKGTNNISEYQSKTLGSAGTFNPNPNSLQNLYPNKKKTKRFGMVDTNFLYTLTFLSKHLGVYKSDISEITPEELESLMNLRVDTTINTFLKNNGHLMLEGCYLSEITADEYIGAIMDELNDLETDELLMLETWLSTMEDLV